MNMHENFLEGEKEMLKHSFFSFFSSFVGVRKPSLLAEGGEYSSRYLFRYTQLALETVVVSSGATTPPTESASKTKTKTEQEGDWKVTFLTHQEMEKEKEIYFPNFLDTASRLETEGRTEPGFSQAV